LPFFFINVHLSKLIIVLSQVQCLEYQKPKYSQIRLFFFG
jgi:hypothetical protein